MSSSHPIPRSLWIAFVAAVLIPGGILLFFSSRAVRMESRYARSAREDRFKRLSDYIAQRARLEMDDIEKQAERALWPFREPVYDEEACLKAVRDFASFEGMILSGVLFDGKGGVEGPALELPFRHGTALGADLSRPAGPESAISGLFPEDSIEISEVKYLQMLALHKRFREAEHDELVKKDPVPALSKYQEVVRDAADEEIGARALYRVARIRLKLGDTRDAAGLAEDFIGRNREGGGEEGIPLRGRMFLLWAEAWAREGSLGRGLEILVWFWDEVLEGRYDMDLEGFTRIVEQLQTSVSSLIEKGPSEPEQWESRAAKRRVRGRAMIEKASERAFLRKDVLPALLGTGGGGPGLRFRSLLLKDRLEVFLFFEPVSFELGLPAEETRGACFRLDLLRFRGRHLIPLIQALSSNEAVLRLLGPGGLSFEGEPAEEDLLTWPLPEPFKAWRVAVSPGVSDPEKRQARSRVVFHAVLVAFALLAVVVSGLFILRGYRRASELAALRSEFVSMVTHDLKTPITSIRTFTETLQMGRLRDADRIREYYGFIAAEVSRLERLIDDILEFARIEAGKREYRLEPLELVALVEDVVETFRPTAEEGGFDLVLTLDPLGPVLGDAEALRRVLWNLLSNAVKFSLDRKSLAVRVRGEEGTAILEVEDKGIGIPAEELPRAFDKFFRGEFGKGGGRSGTGLGLALVRHVVHGHNGRIEVKSAPGEGSRFRIRLPLAPDDGGSDHGA